ncbi:MAG: hypothetical protein K0U20_09380 [Proteobacteria bacterium]|nr:hypothetical protein [Pseudomonadota bacterium]MCH9735792.1 hypothetical protein [Actinomycetes bacterium]
MEELLTFYQSCTYDKPNNIGATGVELQDTFQEDTPYSIVKIITGDCIQWDEDFVLECLTAMSTDSLLGMSDNELNIWYEFVAYEDARTHSANTDSGVVNPVGCTIPDENGNSYTVQADGTITTVLCDDPVNKVAKENISKSLDGVFMAIYNCEEYNNCGIKEGDLVDISPCPEPLFLVDN